MFEGVVWGIVIAALLVIVAVFLSGGVTLLSRRMKHMLLCPEAKAKEYSALEC
jgi:hypothetical protein